MADGSYEDWAIDELIIVLAPTLGVYHAVSFIMGVVKSS